MNKKMIAAMLTSIILSGACSTTALAAKYGYTTANLNVRKEASTDSDILITLPFNKMVEIEKYNNEWYKIVGGEGYIYKKYVSKTPCETITYSVPSNKGYKSWMPYKTITMSGSPQKNIQDDFAYTGNYGIRMVDGRYCVAVGTHFSEATEVGRYFDLVLENDVVIPCIAADWKDDAHTDGDNIFTARNGCCSEFIVDYDALNKNAKKMGDISYCKEEWNSPVCEIIVYDKNILKE